ncbi:MAG: hypothetical protein GQ527_08770 [Bacteroidales bacterium]|nr:hypothetical protein [Bacteroidales bacterium]
MKKLLAIMAIGILLISCEDSPKQQNKEEQAPVITENFDWLLGNWQRSNEKEDRETFETWEKMSKTEYNGIGFALQNNDTISLENMKLIKIDLGWDLKVMLRGESTPTVFNVVKIENESFECTNDLNEFPTKIHYWKDGEKIKATVSGCELEIAFEFVKVPK